MSNVKKGKAKYTIFKSNDGVKPLNEINETQRIKEGSRHPFLEQPSFEKTDKERIALKKAKRKAKALSGSSSRPDISQLPLSVTVHLNNNRAKQNDEAKYFHTTYSFESKQPKLDALILAESRNTTVKSLYVNGKKVG